MWNKQEQMFFFFFLFDNVTTTNYSDPLHTVCSLIAIILPQMEFDLSAPAKDVLP